MSNHAVTYSQALEEVPRPPALKKFKKDKKIKSQKIASFIRKW